jgi:hypothetical protein
LARRRPGTDRRRDEDRHLEDAPADEQRSLSQDEMTRLEELHLPHAVAGRV